MFKSADVLVKAVMIGLAFASLVTWTIFIAKMIELTVIQTQAARGAGQDRRRRSLAEAQFALGSKGSVLASLLAAAMREARLSAGITSDAGIKERAASRFTEIVRAEARRIRLGMGLLATIGATSPFVGLFGTVWGIMNSFIGISKAQTTNLAVVAPGIAEGAACHRHRSGRSHSRRHHLQPLHSRHQGLHGIGQPCLGRRGTAAVARSRSYPCQRRPTFPSDGSGVGDGRIDRRHRPR
jgi:tonB-system energizer ExbB